MVDKMVYKCWLPILEKEYYVETLDDVGGMLLANEGRYNDEIPKYEAEFYFNQNVTISRRRT